jgi:hypothetical protein
MYAFTSPHRVSHTSKVPEACPRALPHILLDPVLIAGQTCEHAIEGGQTATPGGPHETMPTCTLWSPRWTISGPPLSRKQASLVPLFVPAHTMLAVTTVEPGGYRWSSTALISFSALPCCRSLLRANAHVLQVFRVASLGPMEGYVIDVLKGLYALSHFRRYHAGLGRSPPNDCGELVWLHRGCHRRPLIRA